MQPGLHDHNQAMGRGNLDDLIQGFQPSAAESERLHGRLEHLVRERIRDPLEQEQEQQGEDDNADLEQPREAANPEHAMRQVREMQTQKQWEDEQVRLEHRDMQQSARDGIIHKMIWDQLEEQRIQAMTGSSLVGPTPTRPPTPPANAPFDLRTHSFSKQLQRETERVEFEHWRQTCPANAEAVDALASRLGYSSDNWALIKLAKDPAVVHSLLQHLARRDLEEDE